MHEPIRTIVLGGDPAVAVARARVRPCWSRIYLDSDRQPPFATMTALAGPAFAMVMVPARPYGGRRVSLTGTGYGSKEGRDCRGGCGVGWADA